MNWLCAWLTLIDILVGILMDLMVFFEDKMKVRGILKVILLNKILVKFCAVFRVDTKLR